MRRRVDLTAHGFCAAALLNLFGCGTWFPIADVPVVGGTAAERALVAEALDQFDRDIGRDRLSLREVRFGGVSDAFAGSYRHGVIRLAEGLPADELFQTVRHELCHALDDAEGLSSLGEDVFASVEIDDWYIDREDFEGESFATLCDDGPSIAQVLSVPCSTESEATAYAWLHEMVWAVRPFEVFSVDTSMHAQGSSGPYASLRIVSGLSNIVQVGTAQNFDGALVVVPTDVYTGAPSAEPFEPADSDLAPPDDLPVLETVGWQAGPGGAVVADGAALTWDGTAWRLPEDVCVSPMGGLFSADGQIWGYEGDGSTVSWRALQR